MGHLAYENVTSSLQKNYLKQQQQATSLPPNQKKIAKLDFHPFLWVWGRGGGNSRSISRKVSVNRAYKIFVTIFFHNDPQTINILDYVKQLDFLTIFKSNSQSSSIRRVSDTPRSFLQFANILHFVIS